VRINTSSHLSHAKARSREEKQAGTGGNQGAFFRERLESPVIIMPPTAFMELTRAFYTRFAGEGLCPKQGGEI
jgi:hypothetical protein